MATDPLSELRKKLEKKFKESTEIFPDFTTIKQIGTIKSGSAIVDAVTGIGGFPRGRVTELYGGYSTGKTTLSTQASAAVQKADPKSVVLYIDYEHAFDASYAHALGVNLNPNRFVFCQPDYFEQGDQVMNSYVDEGLVDLLIIDSAAAMIPMEDLEGKIDSTGRIGLQAQLMSRMLARITKKISKGRKPAMVIINQTRMKIDTKNARNNGEQSAAGSAIKFYASMRLQLENITGEGEEGRGKGVTDQVYTQNRVRITAIKNKLAPPWIRGQFTLEYGRGVNNVISVAELAEQKLGIMSGAGFFNYKGDTPETSFTCRGREAFHQLIQERSALMLELEAKVLSSMAAEQAASLGISSITKGDAAKELESPDGVLVLGDESKGGAPVRMAPGEGLPTEDLS